MTDIMMVLDHIDEVWLAVARRLNPSDPGWLDEMDVIVKRRDDARMKFVAMFGDAQ